MKRDDETLLEYFIRLAKEKGEGLGEGLQQLGVERLKKARPDVAERRGLLEPQYDETMVMEESSPFPDRSPVFMEEDITSLMSTQEPTPDRASLEAMIAQRMGVKSPGGVAPEVEMQDSTIDMVAPRGPITPRVPTANLTSQITPQYDETMVLEEQSAPSPVAPNPTSGQALAEQRAHMKETGASREDAYKWWMGKEGGEADIVGTEGLLEKAMGLGIPIPKDALRANTGFEDLLKGIMGARGGTLASGGIGAELAKLWPDKVKASDLKKVATGSVDLGVVAKQAKEMITGEKEVAEDTAWIKGLLDGEAVEAETSGIKEAPTDQKQSVEQQISQAKKNTGSSKRATTTSDKPTYLGHDSKEDFLRASGILGGDKESRDFAGRMDEIDSEAGMFEFIAMLGGAGQSRAGKNFRDKSYQRLRTEMQMDDREWDRQYKIMSHPWVTYYWHDPEAGIKPRSVPKGMGMGPGWQQQPTSRDKGTPSTRNYNEILEMWDGTPRSEALMRIRFINEQIPSGMFLDADGQDGLFNNFMDVAFPLPNGGKRWTPQEIQQAKLAISKGSKADVEKMLKRKGYVPPELRAAIKELFPELYPEQ